MTVQSDRARYDDRTKAAVLTGNVRWVEPRDGALGETETIEFDPTKKLLRAPASLHLTRCTFDVTASSGAYDLTTRTLSLAGPIRGSGTGQGNGGLSAISGDSGEYRRDEGVVLLKGNVKASSAKGDNWVTAARMLLKFSPEGNSAEWARAFSSVRGALAPAAGGLVRKYSADEGALFFDLSGDVRSISLKGAPSVVEEPGRRIAGRTLDMDFPFGLPHDPGRRRPCRGTGAWPWSVMQAPRTQRAPQLAAGPARRRPERVAPRPGRPGPAWRPARPARRA